MRKKIFIILRVVISLGLIIFLVSFLNLGRILEITSRIWKDHPVYLFAILLGGIVFVLLEAFRLQQVLRIQGMNLSLPRLIRYCFIGIFFNNFMPTTIGGDVAKGFYISRESGKKAEPFVALAVVRLIGGICLTLISLVALFTGYHLLPARARITASIMVALLVVGLTFTLFFLTRRKLASKFLVILKPFKSKTLRKNVIEVYRLFHSHQHFPLQISLAALASFGIELLIIFLNYMVARGLGYDTVSFQSFLLLIPLIAVITLLPSLNGLGLREGAYIYFFGNQAMLGQDGAAALSLIMLAMLIFLGLAGGLVFAFSGSRAKARPQSPKEELDNDEIRMTNDE